MLAVSSSELLALTEDLWIYNLGQSLQVEVRNFYGIFQRMCNLIVVLYTQNYWVFGYLPSSGVFGSRNDVS
jgi:hypothetical protein